MTQIQRGSANITDCPQYWGATMPAVASRALRQCGAARPSLGRRFGHAHRGDFVDLAAAIIGDPLANLGSVVEVARSHPCAIEPKPFPIPVGRAVNHITLGVNGAVFVVFDVSLSHALKDSTPPTLLQSCAVWGAAESQNQATVLMGDLLSGHA